MTRLDMTREEKTTLTEIRVRYKYSGNGRVNEVFDRQMEKLAKEYGLEFEGSGYDFETKERDLIFTSNH